MISSRILALLAVALILLASASHAAGVIEIRTAAQLGTEPKYIAQTQDGKRLVVGLCVDIYRAIERVEPSLRFVGDQVWQPSLRMEAEMTRGKLDAVCGLTRTRQREAKFTYIEPPLFLVKYLLAVRAEDEVQINNWDDVRALGKNGVILSIRAFGPLTRLKELGGLLVDSGAGDPKTNLMKLLAGRGRFFYHRSPGIVGEIRKAGLGDKVRLLPVVMDSQKFYLVMGKSVLPETVEKLHKAVALLESRGELKRLLDKWYEE